MYDRLLLAVDHSDVAQKAVDAAQEMALLSNGEVWVLHVVENEIVGRGGAAFPIETDEQAHSVVDHAVRQLDDAGIKTHFELGRAIHGRAAREIVAAARAHNAGVIVMGSRGRGDLAGLVLGSTTHKVMHLSDRPVLVAR